MASTSMEQEFENLPKGLGSLAQFPREIRNMIYKHMIAQGSVAVLRTSSRIKAEASATDIFEHGICRLNLDFYDKATEQLKPCFKPSNHIVDKIRNVAIRVDTRFNGPISRPTPEIAILNNFRGANVHRKTCLLSFECWETTSRKYQEDVLITLRAYTGFEKVEVAIEYPDWTGRVWPQNHAEFSLEQMNELHSLVVAYNAIRRVLTPGLGNSEPGLRQKSPVPVMAFYPRGLEGGTV